MKRMEQLPEVETMHTQWSAVAIGEWKRLVPRGWRRGCFLDV